MEACVIKGELTQEVRQEEILTLEPSIVGLGHTTELQKPKYRQYIKRYAFLFLIC